jgi:IMP dehydrogenase
MKKGICFDDVLMVPKYSEIKSRSEIDISSRLSESIKLKLPIISSPMDTVTEYHMSAVMADKGGMGIVHRYNTIEEQAKLIPEATLVGAAVGVNGDYLERAQEMVNAGAKLICVDIAHGHHSLMRRALWNLKNKLPREIHLMAGNVATSEAFYDLASWGADSIKVGIGGGSICSTRIQTGHGVPTLQSVIDCSTASFETGVKMIADGGIKTSGDIVKSLAAGAGFVMLGSMLAGTHESPGEIIEPYKGSPRKAYRGMASKEAQVEWRGSVSSMEGVATEIPYKGCVGPILEDLQVGIRSGFSYSGASVLSELQEFSSMLQQTNASRRESSTHIMEQGF